ncbi:hypothetical protein N7520_002250 [Penicillium odoratum]|uniref:uncharacterized protein n=1 Tax=Penicillium odoratum TaxID=1167516 RepID=UPI002548B5D6|nr:uncharacterized protein N7520_002250 [Penicillium odoratum]KAJ5771721.1 hypothetical protein N7520_002250 [Penicillium odoratum]
MLAPPSQPQAVDGLGLPLNGDKKACINSVDLQSRTLPSVGWQSTLVTPSTPLVPGCMKLSPLDQVENRFIVPSVFIFHVSSPSLRQPLLQDLKAGLANMIEELPFVAADVIPDCEEQDTIQLQTSDDAGVWLHSQELLEIDYYDLERRKFPPSAFPPLSLMPEPRLHQLQRSPVLTILATFIVDGLLLTFNSHHSVMDAAGTFVVVRTLAKHVGALSDGRIISSNNALLEEALDRSIVPAGSGRKDIADFPTYRLSKTYRCAVERELAEAAVAGDHPKLSLLQKLQFSHWYISEKSMQAMKDEATPLSKGFPVLTDNTILCAVLWRHISRARQLSSRGIMKNSFISTVNVRRRIEPPLPLDYVGNAIVHAKTSSATADVESGEPGMLYKLGRQITNAIEWWTSERIGELIGAIESSETVSKIEPNMDNFQGPDLEVTSVANMDEILSVDWGFGISKVKAVRYCYLPVKDGWVNVLPQGKDGGIDLLIGLENRALNRLRQDKEWLQLAQEFQ